MDPHWVIRQWFKISTNRAKRDNFPIGTRRGSRDVLGDIFRELGLNRGAEIGVKQGDFSKVLCEKNPNIELYCIDSWNPRDAARLHRAERYYRKAIKKLAPFNATLIKKTSMEALDDFENFSLDFVYIDANHSFDYCCPDIIFWSRKVRAGGIIACHDYFHHMNGGVVRAVDAYVLSHNIRPWYVTREIFPTAFWVKPKQKFR